MIKWWNKLRKRIKLFRQVWKITSYKYFFTFSYNDDMVVLVQAQYIPDHKDKSDMIADLLNAVWKQEYKLKENN